MHELLRNASFLSLALAIVSAGACGNDSRPRGDGSPGGGGDSGAVATDLCEDSCDYANDGECDDGAEGSTTSACGYGTDCGDCGSRSPMGCTPSCGGAECGPDGCGGTCGECAAGLSCGGGTCVDLSFVGRPCDTCDAGFEADGNCLGSSGTTREMCGSDMALCRRGGERPNGYCTIRCDDTADCPEGYYCGVGDVIDGSGCFFGSP